MSNTITFRKMGIDFYKEEISDVGNYRVRTEFTDKNGTEVIADFGGYTKMKCVGKNNKRVVDKINCLHLDATRYEDNDRRKCAFSYSPEYLGINVADYEFTKKDLIRFINDVTGENYTEIEFV